MIVENHTYKTVINIIPDGILYVLNSGLISICNKGMCSILGIPDHSIHGKYFHSIFSDDVFGFSMNEIQNDPIPQTIAITLSNGISKTELEIETIPNDDGIVIIARNRSSYKQIEISLNQHKNLSAIENTMAVLAHEIRNPLSCILGFAHLLKREPIQQTHKQMLQYIIDSSSSVNKLIENIFEYTGPEKLHLRPVNIYNMLSNISSMISISLGKTMIILSGHKDIIKNIDEERMKQAVWNILTNAIEASDNESFIYITTCDRGFNIMDHGHGISSELLPNIFTPFFTTKSNGSGIGLAISHKIITSHGGAVRAYNNTGCKGMTFSIQLI